MRIGTFLFLFTFAGAIQSHSQQFPVVENLDSVIVPALPSGWTSTSSRSPSGDFVTTSSLPHSAPNALISTDATVAQVLTSPGLDFTGMSADSLKFSERRSGSHNSALLVEASSDGGKRFPIRKTYPAVDRCLNKECG